MFFSTYVLTKKGPLAKVWLAAHWDRKLTKNEVKVVNLRDTVVQIIRPVVPIAIRTSGELLIGVVRIYALKVKHLLREATEATVQLLLVGMAGKSMVLQSDKKDGLGGKGTTKGNINAVTYEWRRNGGDDAERLDEVHEGHFSDIADILGGLSAAQSGENIDEDFLRAAWYAVEPVANNDTSTQQDFDDIARMRADLMAFGERGGSGSNSTIKSKSSLSSIEKARGSNMIDEQIPFPPVADDFDIGVPMPDELPMEFPDLNGTGAEDPFNIPELIPDGERTHPSTSKKLRLVNVLDVEATTLSRDVFEKHMADRTDIVDRYGARHGPLDDMEENDRRFLSGTLRASDEALLDPIDVKAHHFLPFSPQVLSPMLRHMFSNVVESVAPQNEEGSHSMVAPAADAMDESFLPQEVLDPLDDPVPTTRKRAREGESAPLSNTAGATFDKIKDIIDGRRRRQRRKEEEISCTFDEICADSHRREVARTFVDILSLVAKRHILVRQQRDLGELTIQIQKSGDLSRNRSCLLLSRVIEKLQNNRFFFRKALVVDSGDPTQSYVVAFSPLLNLNFALLPILNKPRKTRQ
eukprot:gene8495-5963_t